MTAKDYLGEISNLDTIIDLKLERIQRLKSAREKVVTEITGMPKGNTLCDRVASITVKIISLEDEINNDIDRLADMRRVTGYAISKVQDETLRELLTCRYLQGWKWARVAKKIGRTTHMTRKKLHPKALNALKII